MNPDRATHSGKDRKEKLTDDPRMPARCDSLQSHLPHVGLGGIEGEHDLPAVSRDSKLPGDFVWGN